MVISYAQDARADIKQLPSPLARRIIDKVEWFAAQADPLHFALPLKGWPGYYRFRIGDYRVLFTLKRKTVIVLLVLAVKHRCKAYD